MNKTAQKYLFSFAILTTTSLFTIVFISSKSLFFDSIFSYQKLYRYQLQKIEQSSPEIVLVGDSSLGNAVDAKLFTQLAQRKTINLALTGAYGYAGSLNMAKRLIQQPSVKQIIVMHTLDIVQRPTSYEGYLYSMDGPTDVSPLTPAEVMNVGNAFLNVIFSISNLEKIWNHYLSRPKSSDAISDLKAYDYIPQSTQKEKKSFPTKLKGVINHDELRFLSKLHNLCRAANVKLMYLHGPIALQVRDRSQPYIQQFNQLLSQKNIPHVSEVIGIEAHNLGDQWDHVAPQSKSTYTSRYFQLLKNDL
jgi:hypothetical protein